MAVVLVTGAGGGLGAAVCRAFDARGLSVVLVGRRPEPLAAVAADLRAALVAPADVREADQVASAVGAAMTRFGRLDVVVNCAALLADGGDAIDGTWTRFSCVLRTNVQGAAVVTEVAAPHLRPGGVVLHVGSSVAALPTPDALAYGASKAALEHLVASLHARHRARGVRVAGLAPGDLRGEPGAMTAAAEALLWLASRQGRFVAGTMVRMDGGEVVTAALPGPGGAPRRR